MIKISSNYGIPDKYSNQPIDFPKILEWNAEAFDMVKTQDFPFFKSATFNTRDIQEVCQSGANGILSLTLVYIINQSSGANELSLLAHAMVNQNLPNNPKLVVSGNLNNATINYPPTGAPDWKQKEIIVVKQETDAQIFNVPARFAPPAVDPDPNASANFLAWAGGFKIENTIKTYQDDVVESPGNLAPLESLQFFFDVSFLNNTGLIDPSQYDTITFYPIVLNTKGTLDPLVNEGEYVSLIYAPANAANEIQFYRDASSQREGFLATGSTYPRQWKTPIAFSSTSSTMIKITDIG